MELVWILIIIAVIFILSKVFGVKTSKNAPENNQSISSPDKTSKEDSDLKAINFLMKDFKYSESKAKKTLDAYDYFTLILEKKTKLKKGIEWLGVTSYYSSNLLEYSPDQIKHILFVNAKLWNFEKSFTDVLRSSLPMLATFMTGLKDKDVVYSQMDLIMSYKGKIDDDVKGHVDEVLKASKDFDEKEYEKFSKKHRQAYTKLDQELEAYTKKNKQ